ncbi:transmembrane ascorbate-dependent reductase CYB561 [Sitodiplosis mosellana]|uniref:transmembrane ascorbate-dependent reductase CYB561 n=1 Tax=Sitodiplosis mosellana TaxID=263140 RepID=UPI0024442C3B|nr:transmembrane ascorbate-dependent reductase CYB561 [Sitodiplosis mosellana]
MESTSTNNQSGRTYADFRVLYLVLQLIGCTLLILMLCWVFVYLGGLSWSSQPRIQFNWHPLLMTLGMVYLYGNSILVYRGLRYARKRSLKISHASIFGTIMLLAIIAAWAVYDSHVLVDPPIPNLYSLHSWIGLIAIILFICQWICGFFSFLYPIIPPQQREQFMPYHVYFGLAGFGASTAAALLGLCEKTIFKLGGEYSQLPSEAVMVNMIGVLILTFAALVLYLATNRHFRRIPLPEDTILLTGHDE